MGRGFTSIVAAVGFLCAPAAPAAAQNRLPPLAADQMTDAQRKAAADFRASRGTDVFGPFVPLLRSPQLMTRTEAMGAYLRYNTALPPRLSEFIILLTARRWTQQYEWGVHQPIALNAGLPPDTVRAVAEGRRPDRLTAEEAILYDFCDELQRNQGVSDTTYDRAVAAFGQQGVVDVVGIVGYYTLQAMVLNTARVPPDAGAPTLAPLR